MKINKLNSNINTDDPYVHISDREQYCSLSYYVGSLAWSQMTIQMKWTMSLKWNIDKTIYQNNMIKCYINRKLKYLYTWIVFD